MQIIKQDLLDNYKEALLTEKFTTKLFYIYSVLANDKIAFQLIAKNKKFNNFISIPELMIILDRLCVNDESLNIIKMLFNDNQFNIKAINCFPLSALNLLFSKASNNGCNKIVEYFKSLGLKPNITLKTQEWGEIRYKIDTGIPLNVTKDNSGYKGIANLCKAIFMEGNKKGNFFSESINNLKKAIQSPVEEVGLNDPRKELLETLCTIHKIYIDNNTDKLRQFIIEKLPEYGIGEYLPIVYTHISADYANRLEDNANALKYDLLALKTYNSYRLNKDFEQNDEILSIIYENLSKRYEFIDKDKSLKYLEMADKVGIVKQEIILNKFINLINEPNLDLALKEAKKFKDPNFVETLKLYAYLHLKDIPLQKLSEKFDFQKILNLKFDDVNEKNVHHEVCAIIFFKQGLINKALQYRFDFLNYIDKLDNDNSKKSIIETEIIKIYRMLTESEHWQHAIRYLNFINKKYQETLKTHYSVEIAYYESIICGMNNFHQAAVSRIHFINSKTGEKNDAGKIAEEYFKKANLINRLITDFKDIPLLSKLISALTFPQNIPLDKILYILEKLIDAKEKKLEAQSEKNNSQIISSDNQSKEEKTSAKTDIEANKKDESSLNEEQTTFAIIDWSESKEELDKIANLDPKAIHAYFQEKKKQSLKTPNRNLNAENDQEWVIDNVSFSSKDSSIYKLENKPGFYATISPKLLEKLDKKTQEQFINALHKGEASKSFASNGIKFMKTLIKLKINDDFRLITNKLYKNPEGNYLIIFEEKARHKDVDKAEAESCIQVVQCSYKEKLSDFKELHEEIYTLEDSYPKQMLAANDDIGSLVLSKDEATHDLTGDSIM
jgi:hypothetical protein